jgi:hypothetical protein
MTDAFDVEQSHGVRVDQLQAGDQVIMFGRAVRIVAAEPPDAGTRRVVLRTRKGHGDADVILSGGWPLVAVDCPRVVSLACLLCHTAVSAVINLARPGRRSAALCSNCQAPVPDGPAGDRTAESVDPDGAHAAADLAGEESAGEQLSVDEAELLGFDGTLRDGSDPARWGDLTADQKATLTLFRDPNR